MHIFRYQDTLMSNMNKNISFSIYSICSLQRNLNHVPQCIKKKHYSSCKTSVMSIYYLEGKHMIVANLTS